MLILFTSEISACLFSDRPPVSEVPPLGEEGSECRVLSSGLLEDGAIAGQWVSVRWTWVAALLCCLPVV